MRLVVGVERFPIAQRGLPCVAGGCIGTAFAIFKCGFIRSDETRARAAFDGHVTHGHAALH